MSIRRSGPHPFWGSRPSTKLRHTLMSGIVARSWNTVAIPASPASFGEPNTVGTPPTYMVPESFWCTPDRILINVDLPAPLSPSTQVTRPWVTSIDTPSRATTLPNVLPTSSRRRYMSWPSVGVRPTSAAPAEAEGACSVISRSPRPGRGPTC